jgi:hypothetical protein
MLICAFGTAFIVCGYYLSRVRGDWGASAWTNLVLTLLTGAGFVAAVALFYLRPQYGARSFPFLLALLFGHAAVVLVLWRAGILG